MKNAYEYLNEVKMDFSVYEQNEEKEYNTMKKTVSAKKIAIIAACVAAVSVTTAFATGFVGNIIKSVSTGHNTFTQIDSNAEFAITDGLQGKIFDENGNALNTMSADDFDNIYDKDGNKITTEMYEDMLEEATGGLVVSVSDGEEHKINYKYFDTIEDAAEACVFDIKVPKYMPDDYKLTSIYSYIDADGNTDEKYVDLLYTDGDGNEITFFERIINDETAFEAGTNGEIEELTINGRTAVIVNGNSVHFETDDSVSVSIIGNVGEDELIEIAENVE